MWQQLISLFLPGWNVLLAVVVFVVKTNTQTCCRHDTICCPQKCTDSWRCGQKRFVSCPDCNMSLRGEVRSAASCLRAPCRRLSTRLGDALFLSLRDERHPWLATNWFTWFYWKTLANERMKRCWAGCLHMQPRFRLTVPSAGGCGSCFFVSCQVNTAYTSVCCSAV